MAQANIKAVITAEDRASGALKKFGDNVGKTAQIATKAFGVAAIASAGFAVKAAADYEQSLNVFKSISNATAAQMNQVAAKARDLGKDMSLPGISAKDAALAMVELSKAGLSVNNTLAASKGVLSLAKAGQLDTAYAAEIAANALNAFNLKGEEATRVADLLAAAANASSASVHDLALGMQMSSAGAASMKVPVEDLTTLLAAMSNNGIKGSDAGTSLKTMFMALTPTTKKARQAMKELNLDFFDADGTFIGMRKTIEQLQKSTAGLTDEQRLMTIETIFGSDASRAANILIKEGVKGYDKLSKAVNKSGAATELAAAQNAGFKGALDNLKSVLETLAIDVGVKLLPPLTNLLKLIAGGIEPSVAFLTKTFNNWKSTLMDVARSIGEYLSPKLEALWNSISQKLLPALVRLWKEVLLPLVPVFGTALVIALGVAIDALNLLVSILGPLINWLARNKEAVWALIAAITAWYTLMKVAAAFNAMFNALAILRARLVGVTIQAGTARGAFGLLNKSLLGFTGFAVIAAAATFAATKIVQAANRAKAAWADTSNAVNIASNSNSDVISKLRETMRTGTPEQRARAKSTLQKLADTGAFASGTSYAPGGMALVGERGPELVNLPRGSEVIPNNRIRGNMGGTVNINITAGAFMGSETEARKYANKILNYLKDSAQAKGVSLSEMMGT